MGNNPDPDGRFDGPTSAGEADTPVHLLLEAAEAALAGGDATRAGEMVTHVLRRPDITEVQRVAALVLRFRTAIAGADLPAIHEVLAELGGRGPSQRLRQEIRLGGAANRYSSSEEALLLQRLEETEITHRRNPDSGDAAGGILSTSPYARRDSRTARSTEAHGGAPESARAAAVSGREPAGAPSPEDQSQAAAAPGGISLDNVLELLREDQGGGEDAEDAENLDEYDLPFLDSALESASPLGDDPFSGPVVPPEALRTPVTRDEIRVLTADEPTDEAAEPLPFLDFSSDRAPATIHRHVAEHPGISGRELLRRFVAEQSARTSPADLQHSYDVGLDLFGAEAFEQAIPLLIPPATIPNPERLGALELLTRSLYELDRLVEAEPYLKEAIPNEALVTDPDYATLLYWLGKVSEAKGEPGPAIGCYTAAVKLDPSMQEPRQRLRVLLGL